MKDFKIKVVFLLTISVTLHLGNCQDNGYDVNQFFADAENKEESWNGKWFPENPNNISNHLFDAKHNVKMGIPSDDCDNGLVNITMDWDFSSADYTCYDHPLKYTPRFDVFPIFHTDHIPPSYSAMHECMNANITYDTLIPTFGTHRPLWPKYGEYRYVPPQRWIHSLEHGAIVMLYHPCANKQELKNLKSLVRNCLYRHVISPFQHLSPERPFALVSWGSRLLMSKVDRDIVVNFIKTRALKGPEQVSRDGQFQQELIHPAEIVSTQDDDNLCPPSMPVPRIKNIY